MRGGAQSHLMRCDDGFYYVVKFPGNRATIRNYCSQVWKAAGL